MLSVSTLWVAFAVNFLALGIVWTYVSRSYPKFMAPRYWMASAFFATAAALLALLRGVVESILPLLGGGVLMVFACCLAGMGVDRLYNHPVSWKTTGLITGLSFAGLSYFALLSDDMPMRILIYSLGQSAPIALSLRHVMSRTTGAFNPGAKITAATAIAMIAIFAMRSVAALLNVGGDLSLAHTNDVQAVTVLLLVFLSTTWSFGFMLMSIDRLRAEVAELALLDDLTGVANRRHLLQRLSEECERSKRTGNPFALLAIDLDGFKAINDGYGHGAGDDCLRHFTAIAQSRLRPDDLLARAGGDEFCVVMPAATWREGAMISRHILETCRNHCESCVGSIAVAASIGVAQWTPQLAAPDQLIAAADQALYLAKKQGRNRHVVYQPDPAPLRKTA